jgi:hypothetical protein
VPIHVDRRRLGEAAMPDAPFGGLIARRVLLGGALAAALAACAPSEETQAKALAEFLQKRILDRREVVQARPSPDELKSFGRFAADFGVITAFHEEMNSAAQGMQRIMAGSGRMLSINDLVAKRADIAALRGEIETVERALAGALGKADAARAGFAHPEPLKAVYSAAYEKTVRVPAQAFRDAFPALRQVLQTGASLADLIAANPADVKVNGGLLQVAKPALQKQINDKIGELRQQGQAINDAQRRLQSVIYGR